MSDLFFTRKVCVARGCRMQALRCVLSLAALLLLASCGAQDEPPIHESWDEIYMDGVKAGYLHTKVTRAGQEQGAGQQRAGQWQVATQMKLFIQRDGKRADVSARQTSVETPDGKLIRFESVNEFGGAPLTIRGQVEGNQLKGERIRGSTAEPFSLPWPADIRTPFSIVRALESEPLAAGQERTFRQFDPVLQRVVEVRMRAIKEESVDLQSGKADLLHVAVTETTPGAGAILRILWIDRQGRMVKSWAPAHRHTSYKSSRLEAVKEPVQRFDIGRASRVALDRKFKSPHNTRRVVYRVTLRDPAQLFADGATQSFQALDERSGLLTVRAIRPDTPGIAAESRPTKSDLTANGIIQNDDERVRAMAGQVAADERDPWKIAVALERHVKASLKQGETAQALVSAAEVAQSLEGDCTEYAVLLAALCRARGIPARAVVGLVYDVHDSFSFHMWTEVFVADRWVPLDATIGQGGIGAAHLKLADTNFAVEQGLESYWRVGETIGQIVKLEVVEVE
jgi:hypothetical protein